MGFVSLTTVRSRNIVGFCPELPWEGMNSREHTSGSFRKPLHLHSLRRNGGAVHVIHAASLKRTHSEAKVSVSLSVVSKSAAVDESEEEHAPPSVQKSIGSAKLNRWARVRQLRSGASTKLPTIEQKLDSESLEEQLEPVRDVAFGDYAPKRELESGSHFQEVNIDSNVQSKGIYIVSDGTGWTADNAVQAALGQFEHCFVDRGCPVHTHLYSDVNDIEKLLHIIRTAGEDSHSLVVYTLAEPSMRDAAVKFCQLMDVPFVDMMAPLIAAVQGHLGATPMGLPRGAPGRKSTLSQQYYKRIEAVEFTIRQDDGALLRNIGQADIVLVGVSRTSKTPLSTYLAQKGYKVANVPLVLGIPPPNELFENDQNKIFGLTINPTTLRTIRSARYDHLGLHALPTQAKSSEFSKQSPRYHDSEHIREELECSSRLFRENPSWAVIDVTGKAIEETAAVILRIYHEQRDQNRMPRISRRY